MKPIPAFDLRPELAELREAVLAAVARVLDSGRVVLGPEVERFERDFAATLGPDCRAVGVASGTDALAIALRALGVGPGDEVVTVANTAVPTVAAIRETGAVPVFCEVREDTALLDLDALDACLSPRTRAVVPVHLYGNAVDVPGLRERLAGRPIAIVEDCAQAHGARFAGEPVGRFGDAAAFSFYPTKNLGAYGDGGLCVARDAALAERMRSLRGYGLEGASAVREGHNSRLDELQAAILNVKLPRLEARVAERRALAARYDAAMPASARPVAPAPGAFHARHLYVVRVPQRDRVREALAAEGIGTGVHYPVPIHRMPAYAFLGVGEGRLPRSERLAREVLSLPLYPGLAEADVDRVCTALHDALA